MLTGLGNEDTKLLDGLLGLLKIAFQKHIYSLLLLFVMAKMHLGKLKPLVGIKVV